MTQRSPIWRLLLAVAVPVALFVSLVAWAFASPVGSSPDDDYHMASIWCGQGDRTGLCEPGATASTRRVPAALLDSGSCYTTHPAHAGSCPVPPSNVLRSTTRGNFYDHSYPGFYYAVMSVFASPHISVSILAMRMFNALIFTAAVTGLFFALRRGQRGPLLWGTLVASVPLGMFIVPSVNPSSWAVISATVLWLSTYSFLRESTLRRRIIFGSIAILSALIGAGSRSDAAAYNCLAILVASILASERTKRYAISLIFPVALAIVSAAFFLTSGQSGVVVPASSTGYSLHQYLTLLQINVAGLPQLWTGSLGTSALGWFDTALPAVVPAAMTAAYAGVAFWGLRRLPWRKAVSLIITGTALIVVPLYVLMHDRVFVGQYVQPRYILPLVVIFAGLVLFDLKRDDLKLSSAQLIVVGALVSLANGWALYTDIRRYVTGVNFQAFSLSFHAAWWWNIPVSPMFAWALGATAYAVMAAGMIIYARSRPAALSAPSSGTPSGV